ncbi:hypothetical protein ABWH93_01225 [Seohaeicola saemankumensis]|uniref:hypothetical protein n=1 Tax=Seohaeicola saemankumensis TaxID=481181 RepID=UPI0035D06577
MAQIEPLRFMGQVQSKHVLPFFAARLVCGSNYAFDGLIAAAESGTISIVLALQPKGSSSLPCHTAGFFVLAPQSKWTGSIHTHNLPSSEGRETRLRH